MRGGDNFRRGTPPRRLRRLHFHVVMCGCKHMKDVQWRRCNNPSVWCSTAMHSEKWWLYVNCAWLDCASVHQVVKKSFIKQTQPYHLATSAGKFRSRRAAAVHFSSSFCSSSYFSPYLSLHHTPIILLSASHWSLYPQELLSVKLPSTFQCNPLFFFWTCANTCKYISSFWGNCPCRPYQSTLEWLHPSSFSWLGDLQAICNLWSVGRVGSGQLTRISSSRGVNEQHSS